MALLSATAFLLILALLGTQLGHATSTHQARAQSVLLRRIYKTTVVERVLPTGSGGPSGTSVNQSVSGSTSEPQGDAPALVTRTS